MSKLPVIVIEDDKEDYDLMLQIFDELKVHNPVIRFAGCQEAFDFLRVTEETVFIIICDINLPGLSGMKMRRLIGKDEYLRKKSIPFVFYTTSANPSEVDEAYDMIVQGYFVKDGGYERMKHTLWVMLEYWRLCLHPNKPE